MIVRDDKTSLRRRSKQSFVRVVMIVVALLAMASQVRADDRRGSFEAGHKTFLLNGKPFVVKAAELHYPRIPRPYWEHRIKMCRALGMNTICLYVFWNIHEQREGEFDFTGQNDIAAFCRLAQKLDMYVIVRPGPYVCAEWEMGGLPWWLLKKSDIRLRERDPYFMQRVELFMQKVGEQLAPLTIQRGGPIIMVQVENEYGSYGEDKEYVAGIRDIVRRAGFDGVTLFQCDWASNFTLNALDDLLWTMNFGTGANIDQQFEKLRQLRPNTPLMCSEFWSGWFDKWGARHETRPADDMVDGIDEMLDKGISFSLYMTHGGTSFGHWAGANSPGFAPDVTSYDYDAPINEQGLPTPKYHKLRATMQRHADRPLPDVPGPAARFISVPRLTLDEYAPLVCGVDSTCTARQPLTFERLDMGWGTVVYTTRMPAVDAPSTLTLEGAHDYCMVYVGGVYAGRTDRVRNEMTVVLPPTAEGTELVVVAEGMGRINFGRAINDRKGLTGRATISATDGAHDVVWTLNNWTMHRVPDDYDNAIRALERRSADIDALPVVQSRAGYYRGHFDLRRTGDTFINMSMWGKGQVYVNGHAIGRFWSIGPQQTLYVPGCWLKKGRNEVVVLDVVGPQHGAQLWCQAEPELDMLNIGESTLHNNPADRPDLNSTTPAAQVEASATANLLHATAAAGSRGRRLAIEILSAHDATDGVAIAEVTARDADGNDIDRSAWTPIYADSEDAEQGNHTADKAFDLQETTFWRTKNGAPMPHLLVIDMGAEHIVGSVDILTTDDVASRLKDVRIYVY